MTTTTTNQTQQQEPAPWLPTSTIAAQSMRAVEQISDPDERRVAFAQHMEQFPPTIGRL